MAKLFDAKSRDDAKLAGPDRNVSSCGEVTGGSRKDFGPDATCKLMGEELLPARELLEADRGEEADSKEEEKEAEGSGVLPALLALLSKGEKEEEEGDEEEYRPP